jgi:hypothetical protein
LKGAAKLELQARIATNSALDVAIRKAVMSQASALAADFPKSFGSNQRAKQTKLEDIASNISRGKSKVFARKRENLVFHDLKIL